MSIDFNLGVQNTFQRPVCMIWGKECQHRIKND